MKPISNRIVQDILDLPRVLEKIAELEKIAVHGKALSNYQRILRVGG